MNRRILTVRELAELVPAPERAPTPAELEQLVPSDVERRPLRPDGWGPWSSQESDRVPPWPPLPQKKAN